MNDIFDADLKISRDCLKGYFDRAAVECKYSSFSTSEECINLIEDKLCPK